jgi:hypothetical protein
MNYTPDDEDAELDAARRKEEARLKKLADDEADRIRKLTLQTDIS